MADRLNFELVSPERLLMSAQVRQVNVPGSEGDFGVLPDHAPVISTLRSSVLEVIEEDGNSRRIFVRGGFADMADNRLTVLAEEATDLADIDRADLEQQIKDAGEDVADARDDDSRAEAEARLAGLREVQAALHQA